MPETDTPIIELDKKDTTESTEPVGSTPTRRGGRWGGRIAAISTVLTLAAAGIGIGVSKASSADSDRPPGVEQVDKLHHMRQLVTDIDYQELLPLLTAENKPSSFDVEGRDGSKINVISLRKGFQIDEAAGERVIDYIEERIGTTDMIDPHRSGKEKEYVRESRDPKKPHVMIFLPSDAPLPSWQELSRVGSGSIASTVIKDNAIITLVRIPEGETEYGDTEQYRLNRAFAVEAYQSLIQLKAVDGSVPPLLEQSAQEMDANGFGLGVVAAQHDMQSAKLQEISLMSIRFDANSTSTNATEAHFYPSFQKLSQIVADAPKDPIFKKSKK